jgi:hypothetical protein
LQIQRAIIGNLCARINNLSDAPDGSVESNMRHHKFITAPGAQPGALFWAALVAVALAAAGLAIFAIGFAGLVLPDGAPFLPNFTT